MELCFIGRYANLRTTASCFKILQDTLANFVRTATATPTFTALPAASVAHCLGGSSRRNIELSQLVPRKTFACGGRGGGKGS